MTKEENMKGRDRQVCVWAFLLVFLFLFSLVVVRRGSFCAVGIGLLVAKSLQRQAKRRPGRCPLLSKVVSSLTTPTHHPSGSSTAQMKNVILEPFLGP